MNKQPVPGVFHLDVNSANGTPFRFVLDPANNVIRYYDRRYPKTDDQPGYGVNHFTEDGQACGPALTADTFARPPGYGLCGWHKVDVWDVDRKTMALVGSWIELVMEARS